MHNLFVLEDIKKSDAPSAAIKNYLEQEKRLLQLPRIQYIYFFPLAAACARRCKHFQEIYAVARTVVCVRRAAREK